MRILILGRLWIRGVLAGGPLPSTWGYRGRRVRQFEASRKRAKRDDSGCAGRPFYRRRCPEAVETSMRSRDLSIS